MMNNYKTIPVMILGLTLCLIWGFSGCGLTTGCKYLKNQLICGFDGWMKNSSRHALTSEKDLQEEENQSRQFLFSNTSPEHKAGNCLTVTYTLKVSVNPMDNYKVFPLLIYFSMYLQK
ncbi:MAG: hypothetical protein K2K10_00635 [Acetatifactor sp.]|nr:hypothetical protein [Acetatifactor sp.]